jgi:hypothetical protein
MITSSVRNAARSGRIRTELVITGTPGASGHDPVPHGHSLDGVSGNARGCDGEHTRAVSVQSGGQQ